LSNRQGWTLKTRKGKGFWIWFALVSPC